MLRRELLRLLASAPLLGRFRAWSGFPQASAGDGPFGLESREAGGWLLRSALPEGDAPTTPFRVGDPG